MSATDSVLESVSCSAVGLNLEWSFGLAICLLTTSSLGFFLPKPSIRKHVFNSLLSFCHSRPSCPYQEVTSHTCQTDIPALIYSRKQCSFWAACKVFE